MMSEIFGRRNGTCAGKGGSMHIADLEKGMMGANGIVGAGPPLICGAGLAAKFRKNGAVAIAFVGDGGSNQGTTMESLNLSSVWNLPCIFVAENNGYAEATSSKWSVSCENIADRAAAFGMPGVVVDGHDFLQFTKLQEKRSSVLAKVGGRLWLSVRSTVTTVTLKEMLRPIDRLMR